MTYKLLVWLFLALPYFAQKTKAPAIIVNAFEKAFPGATKISWDKEKDDYEVNFTFNTKQMAAVYNKQALLKETEETIAVTALPATVTAYISQHYPKAVIREAAKITLPGGAINYEAEVNKKDFIFDASGKFLRAQND